MNRQSLRYKGCWWYWKTCKTIILLVMIVTAIMVFVRPVTADAENTDICINEAERDYELQVGKTIQYYKVSVPETGYYTFQFKQGIASEKSLYECYLTTEDKEILVQEDELWKAYSYYNTKLKKKLYAGKIYYLGVLDQIYNWDTTSQETIYLKLSKEKEFKSVVAITDYMTTDYYSETDDKISLGKLQLKFTYADESSTTMSYSQAEDWECKLWTYKESIPTDSDGNWLAGTWDVKLYYDDEFLTVIQIQITSIKNTAGMLELGKRQEVFHKNRDNCYKLNVESKGTYEFVADGLDDRNINWLYIYDSDFTVVDYYYWEESEGKEKTRGRKQLDEGIYYIILTTGSKDADKV
ncbi:MAG: hypothetical protein Q4B70_18635, partial [Lachnospiraceae bacterium]|nr:hypothetical protein [Lachnospiraceae bacterium]